MLKNNISAAARRKNKVRSKILKYKKYPRLSVFCSNKYTYAQIIDDTVGKTLVFASDENLKPTKASKNVKSTTTEKLSKSVKASLVGDTLSQKAVKLKITKVVFDKGSQKYHGRVKAVAQAARKGGLIF